MPLLRHRWCVAMSSAPPVLARFVAGHPRPKGSLTPQIVRDGAGRATGRVRMVESSADSSRWRRVMALGFRAAGLVHPLTGSVHVVAHFYIPPLPALGANIRTHPTSPNVGDIDKLVRNLLDALTDAKVYVDDRQVVSVTASKEWASTADTAGVAVTLWELPE